MQTIFMAPFGFQDSINNYTEMDTDWNWKAGTHMIFSILSTPYEGQAFLLQKKKKKVKIKVEKKCFLSPAILFSLNARCSMTPVPVANFIQMKAKEEMWGGLGLFGKCFL